jgi:hypothetical protein
MTQAKTFGWTNPTPAVARHQSIGFAISEIQTTNLTDGKSYYWNSAMPNGYYQTVDTGAVTTSNGFTPLSTSSIYGATISGFTNANPGVITASNIALVGIVAGDTIKVAELADDGAGTASLNGTYTVASVTATAITLVESTVGYSAYVSGGVASRVEDSAGNPIPTENFGIQGILIGTGVVGTDGDVMVANVKGDNSVC